MYNRGYSFALFGLTVLVFDGIVGTSIDSISDPLEANVTTLAGKTGRKSEMCKNKPCLRKCCSFGSMVFMETDYIDSGKCEPCEKFNFTHYVPKPLIYDRDLKLTKKEVIKTFRFINGNSVFIKAYLLKSYFYVLENSTLVTEMANVDKRWHVYDNDHYCIDHANLYQGGIELRVFAIVHTDDDNHKSLFRDSVATEVGMVVSSIFLVATLLVYSLVPSLRNLHGKLVMAYTASLLAFFVANSFIRLRYRFIGHDRLICHIMGVPSYFCIMSTFFWMNTMSFDIWWKFRVSIQSQPTSRRQEDRRFLLYCLYGFGCPLLMSAMFAALNYLPMEKINPAVITPGIADKACFLGATEQLFYLYIPMGIILTANFGLFVATALNISKLKRGARILQNNGLNSTTTNRVETKKFTVYVKIFCLMGVTWVFEIISTQHPQFVLWYITDAWNGLIGVMIFLTFIGKKRIVRLMHKRYNEVSNNASVPSQRSRKRTISNSTEFSDDEPVSNINISNHPEACK